MSKNKEAACERKAGQLGETDRRESLRVWGFKSMTSIQIQERNLTCRTECQLYTLFIAHRQRGQEKSYKKYKKMKNL